MWTGVKITPHSNIVYFCLFTKRIKEWNTLCESVFFVTNNFRAFFSLNVSSVWLQFNTVCQNCIKSLMLQSVFIQIVFFFYTCFPYL